MLTSSTDGQPARTPRHFALGVRVIHAEHGPGTITAQDGGAHTVVFDSGATGTPYTRIRPLRKSDWTPHWNQGMD